MTEEQTQSRWDRRKERTRRRLLAAAERLFRSQGFDDTTVEEIADRADVAKGTFFNYFESKASLLGELLYTRMAELLETPPGAGQPAPERIDLLLRAMWGELAPYRHLVQQMLAHVMSHPRPEPAIEATPAGVLADLVREGQAKGIFRADIDAEIAGVLLSTLFFRLCLQACRDEGALEPCWQDGVQKGLDVLYHGLMTS